MLEYETVKEVIIIQGNHDSIIRPIAEKRGVLVVKEYSIRDILIVHGDEFVEIDGRTDIRRNIKRIKRIIIGHEHPAITIRDGSKWEKYKCFLKGKWKVHGKSKELIVIPSFNPLLEGTDILKEKLLSPYLENISQFKVFVVGESEVYEFGSVEELIN